MDAEELLTTSPTAEAVAAEVERLPPPPPEKLEALRRTLENARSAEQTTLEREWPPLLQTPRGKKDSRYAEPPTSHRPVLGPLLVFAKRTFRLGFQPFINEMLRKQVEFNEAILDALATMYEHQQLQSRTQAQWRKEVAERLARLERKGAKDAAREGSGEAR
jgi:hypothetical protein